MNATPALETRALTIRFGGHVAVNAVSCAFAAGTLTAIVGPNDCEYDAMWGVNRHIRSIQPAL